jgi:hypothetical protein
VIDKRAAKAALQDTQHDQFTRGMARMKGAPNPGSAVSWQRQSTAVLTDMDCSTRTDSGSPPGSRARPINECRDAIAAWLTSASIQQTNGAGRGGIVGKFNENGRAMFLYGEITGYWLRWASIYAPDPARMGAAVEFLQDQWSGSDPAPTRFGAGTDWRNGALFSFDLAMLLRGLADATPVAGHDRCARTAARIVPWLDRMVDAQGLLLSHRALNAAELPARWSTRPGPSQAKTAAAILQADEWLTPQLRSAARQTLAYWRERATEHRDLHPRFYAWEGHACAGGAIDVATVLAECDDAGMFPEQAGVPGSPSRGDIQAQGLRLLCLGAAPDRARDAVATALLQHVQTDGSVRCHLDEPGGNVWCALFAHQALDWLCALRGRPTISPDAASII